MDRETLQGWWRRAYGSAMFFGLLATAVRVGVNLFLIPLILIYFTQAEQSVWWVFISLGNFLNVVDFGLGPVVSRAYSFLWAGAKDVLPEGISPVAEHGQPNHELIRRLNATVRHFYLWLAVAATVVLGIISLWLLDRPISQLANPQAGWWVWWANLVALGYAFSTGHWVLAAQGANRVREAQVAIMWSGLAYLVVGALLLACNVGLLAMVAASFTRGLVMREICRRAYRKVAVDDGPPARPDYGLLSRLWPVTWKSGMTTIGGYLTTNGPVLISASLFDAPTTASLGLTVQVGVFVTNIAALWLTVKWPYIAMLRAKRREPEMMAVFMHRLMLAVGSFIVMSVALVFVGNALLEWKGTHTQLLERHMLVLYLGYLAFQLFYSQCGLLVLTENVVPFHWLSLVTGVAIVAVGSVLADRFGVLGLLLAAPLVDVMGNSWYTMWRAWRGQPLGLRQLCRLAVGGTA